MSPIVRRRLLVVLSMSSVFALLAVGLVSAPVGAQSVGSTTTRASDCPVLSLGNPGPGDLVPAGGFVVSGTAYDPAASTGSGVSRVDLFLGAQDQGGTFLGSAVPGSNGGSPRDFSVQVTIPDVNRAWTFVAYAYSALSNGVTSVSVPIQVGVPPTPVAHASGATATPTPQATSSSTCGTVAPAAAQGASASSPSQASQPSQVSPPSGGQQPASSGAASGQTTMVGQAPVLMLGNPNANDSLSRGAYVVSGIAYDPAAPSGSSGISRIEFFIGARDAGGVAIGTAVTGTGNSSDPRAFQATVNIPSSINGGHDFYAYAESSVTGHEAIVSVPVFIGQLPTPTPRP